jgi:hypothetical protein
MDKEVASSTHEGVVQGGQDESTGPGFVSCVGHGVLATCQFIGVLGKGAGVLYTLEGWV